LSKVARRLSHLRRLRAIGAAGRKSLLVVGSRARPGQTFSSEGGGIAKPSACKHASLDAIFRLTHLCVAKATPTCGS
jgi:hypothetical protein